MKLLILFLFSSVIACAQPTLLATFPDFEYGNLESLHPAETFEKIKSRRLINWVEFRRQCEKNKLIGGAITIATGQRLEVYNPIGDIINMNNGNSLTITGSAYEIVFYPFVPRVGYNYIFDMAYGSQISITGGTLKAAQRMNYFESYLCVLKKSSNTKLVEVLGTTRSDFWTSLTVGQTMFYSWDEIILGKTNTIASFDAGAKTITLTNIIDAAVTNDKSGSQVWVGIDFVDGVSEADYLAYGHHWVRGENINPMEFSIFHNGPAASTGPDTIFNLTDCKFENWKYPFAISSGAFKVNLYDTVEINYAEVAISGFARSQLNHQSILGPNATLIFREDGVHSVGSLDVVSSGNIWGSGAYIHPTVIVHLDKFLGYNNLAFTFRQYSTSIEVDAPEDYVSWINDFRAYGSGEGDLKTSNCMPVTIGYFYGEKQFAPGGDLVVNGGVFPNINLSFLFHPQDYKTSDIRINNATLNGYMTSGWPELVNEYTDITFNNCIFYAQPTTTFEEQIKQDGPPMKSITINNCQYRKPVGSTIQTYVPGSPEPAGDAAAAFIRPYGFLSVTIDSMITDPMKGVFFQQASSQVIPPFNTVMITLDNSDITMSRLFDNNIASARYLSDQIQGSRTSIGNFSYVGHGHNLPLKLTPKIASTSKSILTASQTYEILASAPIPASFSVSNVLEIDGQHNEYFVNAGTIKHIAVKTNNTGGAGTGKMSSSSTYDGSIIIHAVGGTVTINKWDASTNEWGNVRTDVTITSGNSATLVCDNKGVIAKDANSTISGESIGTGNGVLTVFTGVLANYRLVKSAGLSVTAGAITGTAGANGLIVGTGIDPVSYVDYGTGTYYVKFTSAVGNAVPITVTYDKYNTWRASGTWSSP